MATHGDVEDQGTLDRLDSALLRAIKGALWFPFVYVPRQLHRSFPVVMRLLRVFILFEIWLAVVFGPAMLLVEVDEPVAVVAILAWTVLALAGSLGGVLRSYWLSRAAVRTKKPKDLNEVFA